MSHCDTGERQEHLFPCLISQLDSSCLLLHLVHPPDGKCGSALRNAHCFLGLPSPSAPLASPLWVRDLTAHTRLPSGPGPGSLMPGAHGSVQWDEQSFSTVKLNSVAEIHSSHSYSGLQVAQPCALTDGSFPPLKGSESDLGRLEGGLMNGETKLRQSWPDKNVKETDDRLGARHVLFTHWKKWGD